MQGSVSDPSDKEHSVASYPTQGTDPWWTPLESFLGVALNTSTGALNSTAVNTALPNVGTAGTYGDATHVPRITTDAEGRVSAATSTAIIRYPCRLRMDHSESHQRLECKRCRPTVSYRKIGSQVLLPGSVTTAEPTSSCVGSAFTLPSG